MLKSKMAENLSLKLIEEKRKKALDEIASLAELDGNVKEEVIGKIEKNYHNAILSFEDFKSFKPEMHGYNVFKRHVEYYIKIIENIQKNPREALIY